MMTKGVEMALSGVFRALGVDGEQLMNTVNNIAHTIVAAKQQLDRIEAKLDKVIARDEARALLPPPEGD